MNYFPVLFIPAGVSIILYFDLIKAELVPIIISVVVSTIVVLIVTGKLVDFLQERWGARD